MPVKYIPYQIDPLRGQAVLPFLRYHKQLTSKDFHLQGIPYFDVDVVEKVNQKGKNMSENLLIHGDCLNACAYLKEQGISVDLVYIDPPFASGANYAKKIYIRNNPKLVAKLEEAEAKIKIQAGEEVDNTELQALEETMYGDIWQKEDYLNWLYERLLAIKEVMSDTASIYVHLDWHIGHYAKVLMDEVFGEENFINEIIWCYSQGGRPEMGFPNKHDTILFYSKDRNDFYFDVDGIRTPYELISSKSSSSFTKTNENGRKYKEIYGPGKKKLYRYYEDEGKISFDWWTDIPKITGRSAASDDTELVDYVTQKPEKLLNRVISGSSNKKMVVADFFGGSGVTAKVAHDLGRKFITADVGINAVQTMRDRLVEAGVSFDILKIRDGIDLFRNPQQTMDKLASIIPSLSTTHDFGKFWFGAITDKDMVCPCWIPNLLDKKQAVLNAALFSKILDETAKLDGVSKVVVCSVDMVDETEIKKMIKDYDLRDTDGKPVQFVFKDLKELIDLIVSPDAVEFSTEEKAGKHTITFDRFISDYLMQKITEFNTKRKPNQKAIDISDEGLELIEFISVDCTNGDGVWTSDSEIKIDKKGYMIVNGEQTKKFWDGTITTIKKPLRLKVRNIAGDEALINI